MKPVDTFRNAIIILALVNLPIYILWDSYYVHEQPAWWAYVLAGLVIVLYFVLLKSPLKNLQVEPRNYQWSKHLIILLFAFAIGILLMPLSRIVNVHIGKQTQLSSFSVISVDNVSRSGLKNTE